MRARLTLTAALAALLTIAAPAHAQSPTRGGQLTYLTVGDVDFVDPGASFYGFGLAVINATQRTLYANTPSSPSTPVPDLATGPPEISPDGRTVTVRIRSGVRYAPPVNREVVAGDVKYAFERAFVRGVANGYVRTYFGSVEGLPRRYGKRRPIRGIVAVDAHTLRFTLTRRAAGTVAAALTLPITAPVPPEYAKPLDRKTPSGYERAPAFSGPYVIAQRRVNRSIRLARNPNWDPATDFRPAYLDTIRIDERVRDTAAAARRTLSGSRTICCVADLPPAVVAGAPAGQVATVSANATAWIDLNTTVKPFTSRAVRRAVAAGLDRQRLAATTASTGATVATHFLPPGVAGFDEAGGAAGFPDVDFLAAPGGDRAVSARYFRQAGFRKGRYTGKRRLLVVADERQPRRTTADAVVRQLRRMGFRLRVRHVSREALIVRYCGRPRAAVAICPNGSWQTDFADPVGMLQDPFAGFSIFTRASPNWSQLRVPAIDRALRAADGVLAGPDRNAAYAAIDRQIVGEAPSVPFAWDTQSGVRSADVAGAFNPATSTWDLSFTG